jgi:hypothetical protein
LATFFSYVLLQRYNDPYIRLVSQHDYHIHIIRLSVMVHTGDPGRYARKALGTGISLHRGPFTNEGNLESGGGLVYWGL